MVSDHINCLTLKSKVGGVGMHGRSASIAGVGYTELTKSSGSTPLSLAVQACISAAEDAGLPLRSVDGVIVYGLNDTTSSAAVATELRLLEPRWTVDLIGGGHAACAAVGHAAAAVEYGLAESVFVVRAANGRSGRRLGGVGEDVHAGGSSQYLASVGLTTYPQQMAMWARRYVELYHPAPEAYAGIAVKSRTNALGNDRAIMRTPITIDDYFDSPMIVDPFRLLDICPESDGAVAVLVTSGELAKDLRQPPVSVVHVEHGGVSRPGADLEDFLGLDDLTENFAARVSERVYKATGLGVADLDLLEIYDCFTHTVLLTLEGLGVAPKGQASEWVLEPGAMTIGGDLPVNTHGGLLSEGYLMGLSHVAEAVLQLRGSCGDRQVKDAEVALVTAGAMMQGSIAVLRRD
jgi:acetyl-CoA acetyltransferase